jgi:hypothetical protein
MAARRRRGWPARYPIPRPASCREHPHRRCGREPARADGPHGPQQHPRRADLPALIRRTAAEARRCDRRGCPGGAPQDGDSIWHVRGTRDRHPTVNFCSRPGYTASELVFQIARPAGFEPATGCLEGSCSVRLSYGRPGISVAGEDHASATCGSQCVATSAPQIASVRTRRRLQPLR